MEDKEKIELLAFVHRSLSNGIRSAKSTAPREWLAKNGLSFEVTGACFNSGQIHHRKEQSFKDALEESGFLKKSNAPTNAGQIPYTVFGNYSVIFPLRNNHNDVVNFYASSIEKEKTAYMNEEGIYPGYPDELIKKLFITENILDAATMLESKVMDNREAVIALCNGKLLRQHEEAISKIKELNEVIIIRKKTKGQEIMKDTVRQLRELIGKTSFKQTRAPENESLNTTFQLQGSKGVSDILHSAGEYEEVEMVAQTNVMEPAHDSLPADSLHENAEEEKSKEENSENAPRLEVLHENKLLMRSTDNYYYVLGGISQDLSSMRITLMIEDLAYGRKERVKLDLYEREPLQAYSFQLAEMFGQQTEVIESDLSLLTELLEEYREKQIEQVNPSIQNKRNYAPVSPENQKACIDFLSKTDVIDRIDKLIEATGVVGEEITRKLIFVIASTYKMSHPLHALVQGSSGSGKSHLINTIGQCFPPEEVMSMTRVTSKSFYHYSKDQLVDKLMLIQDFDGLDEEAQYAFRELQSAGNISSSTTYKDRYGNLLSMVKTVKSHFASLLATTKADVYYDNMSRSVIIGVDESEEQTRRIVEYQNRRLAGLIDEREEKKAKEFIRNCMRCLKPHEVVNPYADKIRLPIEAKMLRRLNSHYQAFVKQITILHQYQRKKDKMGRLIAEPQDLRIACDILFDAIMLKVDDLDSSLRQFFDRMKVFIKDQAKGKHYEYQFTQRDVRLALNVSKASCFRYMEDLELLEYVQRAGGYANRGFKYKIVFWDDMEKIRKKIKQELKGQLELLEQSQNKEFGGSLFQEHAL
ncbi:MAG TPA: hypothetical protein VNW99_12495 [Cytophagaceae bacterium]|jgi:DNA primase|nr:hypothetical protein [Cytophagaceae bacterium]